MSKYFKKKKKCFSEEVNYNNMKILSIFINTFSNCFSISFYIIILFDVNM